MKFLQTLILGNLMILSLGLSAMHHENHLSP